jgi:hypothetical protein
MRRETLDRFVSSLNPRTFTNSTQRALYTLLRERDWVSLSKLRHVPSAARRLRKVRALGFNVVCRSASELDLPGDSRTYYYRLAVGDLTVSRLREVFN